MICIPVVSKTQLNLRMVLKQLNDTEVEYILPGSDIIIMVIRSVYKHASGYQKKERRLWQLSTLTWNWQLSRLRRNFRIFQLIDRHSINRNIIALGTLRHGHLR